MSTWTNDELDKIAGADELQLAARRGDGTLRRPVTIWVARAGDDLYVRSVYGRESKWFHGVEERHEGRIRAGGVEKEVVFVEVEADDRVNNEIDAGYRTKYRSYPARYVDPTVTPQARAATLKLVPR